MPNPRTVTWRCTDCQVAWTSTPRRSSACWCCGNLGEIYGRPLVAGLGSARGVPVSDRLLLQLRAGC